MGKILLIFEKGGTFELVLNEKAPKTCKAFLEHLPYEADVLQARFSGTECFFRMPLGVEPENIVDPKTGYVAFNSDNEQAICIYYDSNIRPADPPYNFFATIKGDYCKLKEVGLRIWREGSEKVKISMES
ncbi:MAG TPA: DUF3830 family protein [Clostridiaceae bacterium]|nr:DUF3830 family protein [Clostridiaceae bacterium]